MSTLVKTAVIAVSCFILTSVIHKLFVNSYYWLAVSAGCSVGITVAFMLRDMTKKGDFIVGISTLVISLLSLFFVPAFVCGVLANGTLGDAVVGFVNAALAFGAFYLIDIILCDRKISTQKKSIS